MKATDFNYNWFKLNPDNSQAIAVFGSVNPYDMPPLNDDQGHWVPSGWNPPEDHKWHDLAYKH